MTEVNIARPQVIFLVVIYNSNTDILVEIALLVLLTAYFIEELGSKKGVGELLRSEKQVSLSVVCSTLLFPEEKALSVFHLLR